MISGLLRKIPYEEQRVSAQEQGIFSVKSEVTPG
jgi:hypothetical protein